MGIRADPRKTDRIAAWPQPTTATNVRGFLGLSRYIATFLPALAEYTIVLTPLSIHECDRASTPWTAAHQPAFENMERLVGGGDCLTRLFYEDKLPVLYVTRV